MQYWASLVPDNGGRGGTGQSKISPLSGRGGTEQSKISPLSENGLKFFTFFLIENEQSKMILGILKF